MQPSVGLSRSSSTRGVVPSRSNSNWKRVITNRFSDEPKESTKDSYHKADKIMV